MVMARLQKKGVLDRRREGKTDFYAPKLDRDTFMALRASTEVQALVDQYGDVALSHFAQQVASLDSARRRALQRLARESWRCRTAEAPWPRPSGHESQEVRVDRLGQRVGHGAREGLSMMAKPLERSGADLLARGPC